MAELPRVMGCGCCTGMGGGGGGGQGRPPKVAGARVWKTGFPGFNPLIGVRTATVVNHALSGLGNINGMAFPLEEGDYVLARGQTDKTQNGVYAAAAGAWTKVTVGYDRLIIQVWEGNQAGWYLSGMVGDDIIINLYNGPLYGTLFQREILGGTEFRAGAFPWNRNSTSDFLTVFGILKADTVTEGTGSFNPSGSFRSTRDGADALIFNASRGWAPLTPVTNSPNWIRRRDGGAVLHPRTIPRGTFVLSSGAYYIAGDDFELLTYTTDPATDPVNWFPARIDRFLPIRLETAAPYARYRRWRETSVVTCPDGHVSTGTREWLVDWQGSPRSQTRTELVEWTKMDALTAPLPPPTAAELGALAITNVNLSIPDEKLFEFPRAGGGICLLIEASAGGTSWTSHLKIKRDWFFVIGGPQAGQHYAEYFITQTVEVSDEITDAEVEAKWRALVPATLNEQPWGFYQFLSYWSDGTVRNFGLGGFTVTPTIGARDDSNGYYGFGDSYLEGGIAQFDV